MSENELQARGQGFFQLFGNRAAVLEPTELLNRPDSKLLLFWSFFFCAALRLLFSNEISQKSKRPAAEAVATIGDLLRCLISRKTVALINLGSHAKKKPSQNHPNDRFRSGC